VGFLEEDVEDDGFLPLPKKFFICAREIDTDGRIPKNPRNKVMPDTSLPDSMP
jgi:hypothetical protein